MFPAAQGVHEARPGASATVPGLQWKHCTDELGEKEPAGHCWSMPLAQYEPAGQSRQTMGSTDLSAHCPFAQAASVPLMQMRPAEWMERKA